MNQQKYFNYPSDKNTQPPTISFPKQQLVTTSIGQTKLDTTTFRGNTLNQNLIIVNKVDQNGGYHKNNIPLFSD